MGRGACTFLVPGHSATWVTWVSAPRARARVQFPKAGGEHDGVMDPLSPTQAPLPGSLLVWAGTQATLIRPVVRQTPPCHEGTRLKLYQLCNLECPLGFAALSPPVSSLLKGCLWVLGAPTCHQPPHLVHGHSPGFSPSQVPYILFLSLPNPFLFYP